MSIPLDCLLPPFSCANYQPAQTLSSCTPEVYILESFPVGSGLHSQPFEFSSMYSSTRQPQPSIASSLSAVADTSAAIRRGKLEISAPIPIPTEDLDQLDSRIGDARHRYHSSFSSAKTDTWPRRSTPPTLQDCNRQDRHRNAVLQASCSYSNTSRTSTALTNPHQSMSSLPSGSSVSKSGGIRATFRRLFGSKRRRDTFSTAINDQRSVGDTNLHSRA